jgi:hypothetical protein
MMNSISEPNDNQVKYMNKKKCSANTDKMNSYILSGCSLPYIPFQYISYSECDVQEEKRGGGKEKKKQTRM